MARPLLSEVWLVNFPWKPQSQPLADHSQAQRSLLLTCKKKDFPFSALSLRFSVFRLHFPFPPFPDANNWRHKYCYNDETHAQNFKAQGGDSAIIHKFCEVIIILTYHQPVEMLVVTFWFACTAC